MLSFPIQLFEMDDDAEKMSIRECLVFAQVVYEVFVFLFLSFIRSLTATCEGWRGELGPNF